MSDNAEVDAKEAIHGEKLIEVKVRFWTKDIAAGEDNILPKHAWARGVVRIKTNKSHGIKQQHKAFFNSLMDLPAAIEEVLIAEGITLHPSKTMQKYVAPAMEPQRQPVVEQQKQDTDYPFRLQFDANQIQDLAARYLEKQDDDFIPILEPLIRSRGYMTKDELFQVANWKSPRRARLVKENDEELVQEVTRHAFITRD